MSDQTQQTIDGTRDASVPEVDAVAQRYVEVLRQRMKLQKEEDTLRGQLIAAMTEKDIETCYLDDCEVKRVKKATEKIKVETIKEEDGD